MGMSWCSGCHGVAVTILLNFVLIFVRNERGIMRHYFAGVKTGQMSRQQLMLHVVLMISTHFISGELSQT